MGQSNYPIVLTTTASALRTQIQLCTACSIRPEATLPVPFEGSVDAEIMFVGRNPGRQEDKLNRPFVGPGGELLQLWLDRANVDRNSAVITNLVKCFTTADREPKDHEVKTCSGLWLHNELNKFSPRIVVPLGKQAMHYFVPDVKVGTYQGIWYPMKRWTLFYLHHPGYVLRGGTSREEWLGLANRFKREHQEYL